MKLYNPDINKRVSAALPIWWELKHELNVLNALQIINAVIQNSGCSWTKAVEVLYRKNNHKININEYFSRKI